MDIIQIVPRLPPAIDGVGDYSLLLAQELRKSRGIVTRFVVCDPGWREGTASGRGVRRSEIAGPDASIDGFPVYQLRERSAAELLRVLNQPGMPQMVLLQYVGYGYEKRGCPVWLVRALRQWRRSEIGDQRTEVGGQRSEVRSQKSDLRPPASGLRLLTMFHELFATGLPWQSSFWTAPLQRALAANLAKVSNHCLTNRMASARWIARASQRPVSDVAVLPVFSNIGEPSSIPPVAARKPQLLIYGGLGKKRTAQQYAAKIIGAICRRLKIEFIVAFGNKPVDLKLFQLPTQNVGVLPTVELSKFLLASRIGYLDYFDGYLAKSGVFAGYCAHGMMPLLLCDNHSEEDGLRKGEQFMVANDFPDNFTDTELDRISKNAYQWYEAHSTGATGRRIADKLKC